MHTTGPTSYANIRADFEEKNKREPSVLEIFKQTHRKKDGTFVKDTVTQDFLIDVDASIDMESVLHPSNFKSVLNMENKELKTKCNESNGLLKKMTTQFAQILDLFSTGKATTEVIDMAKSVLNMNMGNIQVSDSSEGDDAPSNVD